MNKIQHVNFSNIDDFLEYLPANELRIVQHLRKIVLDSLPHCTEKLAYNVPYYYRNSRICFIWPPSVAWGNVNIKGVQLGFCNGNLMDDSIHYLEKGSRKQVYWKEFHDIKEIDVDLLRAYLFEAAKVNEQLKNKMVQ